MAGIEIEVAGDDELAERIAERRATTAHVAVIDGRTATTEPAFFDAVTEALELPEWFGRNWDALYDVLLDLTWLPAGERVLLVRDALWLLDDEPQERLRILVGLLHAATAGPDPDDRGPALNPHPLTVVLHGVPEDEEALRARYAGVGLDLTT